jgi:rhamnosyltransferase
MMAHSVHEQPESGTRFAVCLAAYNGAQFVAEQIDSILHQRGVDLQLFVSVDQSIDGTESQLAQWARVEPQLTLLPFGHRFGGAAPNFFRLLRDIDLAGFDYLSFADQDDVWHPDKLWRAHHVMTNQRAAGYSSNFTAFWPSGKECRINKAWPQRKWDFLFESAGPGCTYVLDRRLARAFQELVRAADERLLRIDYHDWLAYAFARAHNYRWVIDDWSSMRYRQHANNQIGVNAGWDSFLLRAQRVLAGYGFEQSRLIAELVGVSSITVVKRGLRGGRPGCLWLALQARHCRRKPLDQIWFFISCLLLAMGKPFAREGV